MERIGSPNRKALQLNASQVAKGIGWQNLAPGIE